MKNRQFYVDKILECIMTHNCSIAIDKESGQLVPCDIFSGCENCKLHARHISCTQTWREWLQQEHVEQLLTKEEKEYIENVVKPFKQRVRFIEKRKSTTNWSYILINTKAYYNENCYEVYNLPLFRNNMYNGLEYYKEYTPKELGLFNDESAG